MPIYTNKYLKSLTADEINLAKNIGGFATKLNLIDQVLYRKNKVMKQLFEVDSISRTATMCGVCYLLFDIYSSNNWDIITTFHKFKNKSMDDIILRFQLEGYIKFSDELFKVEFSYRLNYIQNPIELVKKDFLNLCKKKIKQQNTHIANHLLDVDCWCFYHKIIVKII